MKYYRCLKEIEETQENTDINYFITYTFGNATTNRYRGSQYWYDTHNGGYYALEPDYKRYDFKVGWIYQSNDDGKTIKDDSNVLYDLEPIKDYFFEVTLDINAETKELIELKKKKGASITITPLMMDMRNYQIIYRVDCSVITANGRCFSSTSHEDTDIYNSIICCFNKLRTGTLSGYYKRIKDVLEIQKNERIRKHT